MFIVSTLRDIQTGEELLCDYHWNVSSLPDEHKKSGFPRGLLQYCGCGECKLKLRQSKQVLKEKGAESCVGILQQTSELQTQFLRHYFSDSMYVQSADVIDDAVSQYSIQEIFESIDRESPEPKGSRKFLQLGSKLGFESLMASCYMDNIASSFFVSTISTSAPKYGH
jgi:hypothetical protein